MHQPPKAAEPDQVIRVMLSKLFHRTRCFLGTASIKMDRLMPALPFMMAVRNTNKLTIATGWTQPTSKKTMLYKAVIPMILQRIMAAGLEHHFFWIILGSVTATVTVQMGMIK